MRADVRRILLIGLGRWGTNHLRVLRSLPVDLFVADLDEKRVSAADLPQSRCTANPWAIVSEIDAAVVVTPADTHFEMCRRLLEAGKDVFVEKPITMRSAEAAELAALAESGGLILQVGHIFRFDPASVWMQKAIADNRFGPIKMLRARFTGFKRPRPDTGVTFADSIHFIDLFNFLLKTPPRRIHAVLRDFFGRGMDDESLIVLEYDQAGGGPPILATVEAGYHLPGKTREITIVGKDSSAVCDFNVAQYKLKTFENRHITGTAEIKAVEGAVHHLEFPPEEPLRAELVAFLKSIEDRSEPLVGGWDGGESVRVVEGALESARTGHWVDLSK
jgi:predicted dehydrogenase